MLSLDKKKNENDLILVSNKGNEFIFNKKLTIKLSKVINTILDNKDSDDNSEIDNIIPIMFDDNVILLLHEYITYINNNKFNYRYNIYTVDYIFNDFLDIKNNNNNIIIWNFINKLPYQNTLKFYELARYLHIEILEELTLYNLMIKIKNKDKILIDKFKNKIEYIDNKIEIYQKNLKNYIKINNLKKVNWLNLEDIYNDNSSESESESESESYNNEIIDSASNDNSPTFEDINSILYKSNNDKEEINNNITKIKNNLKNEVKKYIEIYKSDIIFLNEKKKYYSNKIKFLENKLTNKILDLSNSSQNIFFMNNAYFCKCCYKVWFLSSLYKKLENLYENYKISCELCIDETLGCYEDIQWDIKNVLINRKFKYNEHNKDEYGDDTITHFKNIYDNFLNGSYGNHDFIKDKCFECFLDEKEFINCGHSDSSFCNDITYKCCKYNYCVDHIDKKRECSNKKCDSYIYICDNCYWEYNSNRTFQDLKRNKDTSICRNCEEFYCNDCIRGRFCKICSPIAYDYHSDYD
jgi:hypothetical protein